MKGKKGIQEALERLSKTTGLKLCIEEEVQGSDENLEKAAETIKALTKAYKEKFDKEYYMRMILEGKTRNCESGGQQLTHLDQEAFYALFLVICQKKEQNNVAAILRQLSPSLKAQQIVFMDDEVLAVLRVMHHGEERTLLEQSAYMMADTINSEAMTSVRVVFPGAAVKLDELPDLYREQRAALRINQIFSPGKKVMSSDVIGMGRMISAVPESVCKAYIKEVTGRECLEKMDRELAFTVESFLNNDLNIAETARILHVHRNTLLYRLEQVRKSTGLDIRCFHDAMACRMLILIQMYLEREEQS